MEMAMLLFNNSRQAVGTSVGYARVALFKEHCDENKIYRYQYLGEKEIDSFMLKRLQKGRAVSRFLQLLSQQ